MKPSSSRSANRNRLGWVKTLIVASATTNSSRRVLALAMIMTAISGLKLITPVDLPSELMRWLCLAVGAFGALHFVLLVLFSDAEQRHSSEKGRSPD